MSFFLSLTSFGTMANNIKPQTFYVLLMTAISVEVEDLNETQAVETAIAAIRLKDPHEFTWVARAVSDRPFDIAGSDDAEPEQTSKNIIIQ